MVWIIFLVETGLTLYDSKTEYVILEIQLGDNREKKTESVDRAGPKFSWKPDRRECDANEPETRGGGKGSFSSRVRRSEGGGERGGDASNGKKRENESDVKFFGAHCVKCDM